MTRGRKFVPPPDAEGYWFTHRGADNSSAGTSRSQLTTTENMLSAPYKPAALKPMPLPPLFNQLAQDQGPPGRRLQQPPHTRHQRTETDFLMHHCRNPTLVSYESEMASKYTGRPNKDLPVSRGRYLRSRSEPLTGPSVPLPTCTTDWNPETPRSLGSIRAANKVLGMTQIPYRKHNPWKYSYKCLPRLYPSYLYRKAEDMHKEFKWCQNNLLPSAQS